MGAQSRESPRNSGSLCFSISYLLLCNKSPLTEHFKTIGIYYLKGSVAQGFRIAVTGQEEKGAAEDEMVGWHPQFNGHEFEQTLGDSEGQGSLPCCSPWGCKESDMTQQLHNITGWSQFVVSTEVAVQTSAEAALI